MENILLFKKENNYLTGDESNRMINEQLKQNNEQIGKNQTELHNKLANMETNRRFLSLSRSEEKVNLDTKFEDNYLLNRNKACLAAEQVKRSSKKDGKKYKLI